MDRIFFSGNKAQRSEPCQKKMMLVAAFIRFAGCAISRSRLKTCSYKALRQFLGDFSDASAKRPRQVAFMIR